MSSSSPLTLGTAGHIDHGKTTLVQALTGKNTDRLAEERRRGISIELGFARLALPNGRSVSVVDVPGHERLVRTMVAGATGIDFFLLVVAADDGVMPQTHEHMAVLRGLGVSSGVVALTKCDLADPGSELLARRQISELVPQAAIVPVHALHGRGLDQLKSALAATADEAELARATSEGRGWIRPGILHVDRVFSVRGSGTVVTGTLRVGTIARGDVVEILPRGTEARVREVQVHDQTQTVASPGQRVALNLARVRRAGIDPGDVVAGPGSGLSASYRLDVELRLGDAAERIDGERLQVHHGTRTAAARVVYLDRVGRFAQLRLESPLLALPVDRVILRRVAPPDTLGGAEVIDPRPQRHGSGGRRAEILATMCSGTPRELLRLAHNVGVPAPADRDEWGDHPLLGPSLHRHPREAWDEARDVLIDAGDPLAGERAGSNVWASAERAPIRSQLESEALRLLRADGIAPRAPQGIADALSIDRARAVEVLERLTGAGAARRVSPGIYYETNELTKACERVVELARAHESLSLAQVRDALATSRKYAQALLEYADSAGLLVRAHDRYRVPFVSRRD